MLAQTVGEILTFAVVISISPIPIIGVVLMLATPRGKTNGLAFLLGWVLALAVVGAFVVFVLGASATAGNGEPETWASVLTLVFGVLLLLMAIKQFNGRPQAGEEPPMPGWMETIDSFTAVKSVGFGLLLAGVNPKNLLLIVGAGVTIASAGLSNGDDFIAMAIFVVIATIGPAIPVAIYFFGGEKAAGTLAGLKAWMSHNNAVIMAVILLVIGVKLIGQGIGGLG